MKEHAWAIYKSICFSRDFIHKVASAMVLSKRPLIHSNSFQPKIKSYLKLLRVGPGIGKRYGFLFSNS
jgi:hypothetical protein